MELSHVGAMVLRHTRLWFHDRNVLFMIVYWPLFDILVWGFLGIYLQRTAGESGSLMLVCILLWQLVCRGSMPIFWVFLEEIQNNLLSNFFALPLQILEWMTAAVAFSIIQLTIVITMVSALVIYFFHIPFILILKALFIFGPPLFISGVAVGLFILQMICMVGKRGQELAWIINWLPGLLSGVFYPVDVLPNFMQKIGYCLPMTYVFDALRKWLVGMPLDISALVWAYFLAILYLVCMASIFIIIFNRCKINGLVRLSD